jgi:hypothetical protein
MIGQISTRTIQLPIFFSARPLKTRAFLKMRNVVALGHSNEIVQVASRSLNMLCHLSDAAPGDGRTTEGGVIDLNTLVYASRGGLFLSFAKYQADSQLSAWHVFLQL